MENSARKRLSICIATYNRAQFIGETIDHILVNITKDCEIVIIDGASSDGTSQIIEKRAANNDSIRYFKQDRNGGADADYDKAVQLARGEYCWLMTDDDLMKPGAIHRVLSVLNEDLSLVLVNIESRNFEMSETQGNSLLAKNDKVYAPDEMGSLLADLGGNILYYLGSVVIRRDIWITREREQYFGTLFVYIGVIFQRPLPAKTLVIAEPLINYRRGNSHTYSSKAFEVFLIRWPKLIWSLPLPDSAKLAACSKTPWRKIGTLAFYRAVGAYSYTDFKTFIVPNLKGPLDSLGPMLLAMAPKALVNKLLIMYHSIAHDPYKFHILYELRNSRKRIRKAVNALA